MKNRIKYVLILLFSISLVVTFYEIRKTYAIFESNLSLQTDLKTAKWNITLNGSPVGVEETTFNVDNINTSTGSEYVKENKIAPGITDAYFDVVFNPNDTDVAVRMDITIDYSEVPSNIRVTSISGLGGSDLTRTSEYGYSKIFTLDDIINMQTNNSGFTIRTSLAWENDDLHNDTDTEIMENNLNLPITVKVEQLTSDNTEIQEYIPD